MSRKTVFAVVFAALATLAQPAHAQWTEAERASCVRECVVTSDKNPNVSAGKRSRCGDFCSCACTGSEKVAPNYDEFNKNFAANQDNETTRTVRALIPACNARAFGD